MPRRQTALRTVAEWYRCHLTSFVEGYIEDHELTQCDLPDLYVWFCDWCHKHGNAPVTYRAFMQRMWVLWGTRARALVVQVQVPKNQPPYVLIPINRRLVSCFNSVVSSNPQLVDLVIS